MRKHSVSPTVLGGIIAACISLGAGSLGATAVLAQTPPAATAPAVPAATPAPQLNVVAQKPPRGVGKTTQPNRKYDRSYKHCKMRALRRGLKGTERRAFIRRCELGFAPPRSLLVPAVVPPGTTPAMPTSSPIPAPTPGAVPARK